MWFRYSHERCRSRASFALVVVALLFDVATLTSVVAQSPAISVAPDDESAFSRPTLALDAGGHTNAVYRMALDPTGYNGLVSVGHDKTIRFWDIASGEPTRTYHPPMGPGAHGYLYCVAFSPDGKYIAASGYRSLTPLYDHRIHLISVEENRIVRSLKGHSYAVYGLAFSPDGKQLASASHDKTVRLWDVDTGAPQKVLTGHTGICNSVAWSPNGKQLISGSEDFTARIWNVDQGTTVAVLSGHTNKIPCVGWSPDGRTVATASADRTIRLWEPSGQLRYTFASLPNEVISIAFSPDSARLAYTYGSSGEGLVGAAILDLVRGGELVRYKEHDNSVFCCVFTPDGKRVITGDVVGRIRIWDSQTGQTLRRLDGSGASMYKAGWSRDGQAIAWGLNSNDCTSDGVAGKLDRTFCFRTLNFGPTPDNTYLRARPWMLPWKIGMLRTDGVIIKRTVGIEYNGQVRAEFRLPQPDDNVNAYTFLPRGRAAVGTSCGIYVIDIYTGRELNAMMDRGEEVWGMALTADWRYLLTANLDQIARVWNVADERLLLSLFAAGDEWIAWTPEGYYAASVAGESLMGWHINAGPEEFASFYPASKFHKSLYRPDVIRRLLEAGNLSRALVEADRERQETSQPIVVVAAIPPRVSITETSQSESTSTTAATGAHDIVVRARAQPAGADPVTEMRLLVNGRPWGDAKTFSASPAGKASPGPDDPPVSPAKSPAVDAQWNVSLPAGSYELTVKADTGKSYDISPPVKVNEAGVVAQPQLHVLAIAPPDGKQAATALVQSLSRPAAGADGRNNVTATILDGAQATTTAVAGELDKLRHTSALADGNVVYFSGAQSVDAAGQLRFGSGGLSIAAADLKRALAAIPGRVTLVLDTRWDRQRSHQDQTKGTCYDTQSANDDARENRAADDFIRDLVSENVGVSVISSMQNAATSSGGSFTQAIADGISGQADEDHDGVVQFNELSKFLKQRARKLPPDQPLPTIELPRSQRSFPLNPAK